MILSSFTLNKHVRPFEFLPCLSTFGQHTGNQWSLRFSLLIALNDWVYSSVLFYYFLCSQPNAYHFLSLGIFWLLCWMHSDWIFILLQVYTFISWLSIFRSKVIKWIKHLSLKGSKVRISEMLVILVEDGNWLSFGSSLHLINCNVMWDYATKFHS